MTLRSRDRLSLFAPRSRSLSDGAHRDWQPGCHSDCCLAASPGSRATGRVQVASGSNLKVQGPGLPVSSEAGVCPTGKLEDEHVFRALSRQYRVGVTSLWAYACTLSHPEIKNCNDPNSRLFLVSYPSESQVSAYGATSGRGNAFRY
eukprot:3143846-Rhodomonas_salina.1